MNTKFILLSSHWASCLHYPLINFITTQARSTEDSLAAEHCPKCREVFGPSIVRTAREFRGFIEPWTAGPLLRIVCPHCSVAWRLLRWFLTLESPRVVDAASWNSRAYKSAASLTDLGRGCRLRCVLIIKQEASIQMTNENQPFHLMTFNGASACTTKRGSKAASHWIGGRHLYNPFDGRRNTPVATAS